MRFIYLLFCVLLFYGTEAKPRAISCPEYCTCDTFGKFERATCQSKKLVSAEIGVPPQVEILDLSYNQISELGNKGFSDMGLTQLKLLNLSNNKISQIHMFGFDGLDSLKTLDLSYNIIEYFLDQWFTNLKNLQELYLQGNNLILINKQPKLDLPSLKVLDLSESKIEYFNPNIFTGLPNLQELIISKNYIQRLNFEVLVPLQNLQRVVTTKNNMQCKDGSVSLLRSYIRKRGIKYTGPCIRIKATIKPKNIQNLLNPKVLTTNHTSVQNKVNEKFVTKKPGKSDKISPTEGSEKKLEKLVNKPETSEKIKNFEKLVEGFDVDDNGEKLDDFETLRVLEKFANSEEFQKMKMEEELNTEKPKNNQIFTDDDDDVGIVINKNLNKIEDKDIADDLEKFQKSKLKENELESSPVINNIVNPANKNKLLESSVPETKKELSESSNKNAWMLEEEDETPTKQGEKVIEYVEVCNGTKKKSYNMMDKLAMDMIEISPSVFLGLTAAFGLMIGMVVGVSIQGRGITSKLKDLGNSLPNLSGKVPGFGGGGSGDGGDGGSGKFFDRFKKKPKESKEDDKQPKEDKKDPEQGNKKPETEKKESDKTDKPPSIEDEIVQKKEEASNLAPSQKGVDDQECESDICDSDPEFQNEGGGKRGGGGDRGRGRGRGGRRGSRSPRRQSKSPRRGSRSPERRSSRSPERVGRKMTIGDDQLGDQTPLLASEHEPDESTPFFKNNE